MVFLDDTLCQDGEENAGLRVSHAPWSGLRRMSLEADGFPEHTTQQHLKVCGGFVGEAHITLGSPG